MSDDNLIISSLHNGNVSIDAIVDELHRRTVECNALRAHLAAVTAERDEARAHVPGLRTLENVVRERDEWLRQLNRFTNKEASEICSCGHPHHRHVGCDKCIEGTAHWDCCDEDECPCMKFVDEKDAAIAARDHALDRLRMAERALREAAPFVEEAAQPEMNYGYVCVKDPRNFHPDEECSTEEERAQHAADCAAWDRV